MLVGTPTARSVTATFTVGGTSGFWCPLPADADGTLPPAATPCPFFWFTDNTWSGSVVGKFLLGIMSTHQELFHAILPI